MADTARPLTPVSSVTTPSPLEQAVQEDDMGASNRQYNFFVSTNSQHQPDGIDRGRIRRLVMRNFFDTRCTNAQVEACASAHNSANTVLAKKQLKSRFRLADVGAETKRSKRGSGNKSKDSDESSKRGGTEKDILVAVTKKKAPKAMHTTSKSTSTSKSASISPINEFPGWQSTWSTHAPSSHQAGLSQNPSTQVLDPFDVLPIPNSPHLTFLFKLYKSTTPLNALATNPSSTWWSFISCSAALLHATLATWALYGLLVCRGVEELNLIEWGLKHKSEAIVGVNRGIQEGGMGGGKGGLVGALGSRVSEEVVGCVAVIASFENLQGTYEAAHVHVVALRRMVHARGGLDAFKHNAGLVKGIIWVDFHTATAHHTPPSFPFIAPDPSNPTLPDIFQEDAACTSPTSLLHLSLAAIECFNIFYRLHRLGLALSPRWFGRIDRRTLSDMLYEAEYMVLNVPDYSRVYIDFDFEQEGSGEEHEQRERDANAAAIVEGTLAASQMFIYADLRGVPRNAKIFEILLERVRRALDRPAPRCLYDMWSQQGNAHVLLWVLVMACSVASDRAWYVSQVGMVLERMGVEARTEMETVLRNVAWVDGDLDRVVMETWDEVLGLRQRSSVIHDARPSQADAELELGGMWDMACSEQGVETVVG
ncbi:hypothetical protein DE146DRAFT_197848 [Phaeosphaeria sp. MPI-PUGE-AT-0046c]|nr:hypothetical protein DE146DRAFT_197848 [Phaeosphaeria sp. MPI-PUGE-AT-0046c]